MLEERSKIKNPECFFKEIFGMTHVNCCVELNQSLTFPMVFSPLRAYPGGFHLPQSFLRY